MWAEHVSPENSVQMRMSTAIVNGSEAENHGHKQNHSDMVSSHFESTKMKNIAPAASDFDKSLSSRVSETEEVNQEEMSCMKDLLLIHLDLIQQQAEQLSRKEKVIDDLKNENEMLKQRLARMERRVSLHKSRGDKKQGAENSEGSRKRRMADAASSPAQLSGKKSFCESSAKRMRSDKADSKRIKQEADENENEPAINFDGKLTTKVAYYTGVGDEQRWLIDHCRPKSKVNLEVPLWRIKQFTSSYSMEGTEDLSDEVFDRRHYKLMLDEKRRKRWDVQRIREQRNIEKLRSREGTDKSNEQPACKSLWPQPGEGLRLAVTPLIPVSAFGINLPSVTTQDFTLPWKEGTKSRRRTKR